MTRIEINRLEIRVSNMPPDTIDSLVDRIGMQILDRIDSSLNDPGTQFPTNGPMMIDRLDAGVVMEESGPGPHDLQGTIADSIVRTITGSLAGSKGGPGIRTHGAISSGSHPNRVREGRVNKP